MLKISGGTSWDWSECDCTASKCAGDTCPPCNASYMDDRLTWCPIPVAIAAAMKEEDQEC